MGNQAVEINTLAGGGGEVEILTGYQEQAESD